MLAILLTVLLAAPFGSASATAVDDSNGLTVEVTVEYSSAAEAVIARPYSQWEELPPTAMTDLGDGTYRALVVLPTFEDWTIGFEAFRADGETDLSDGATIVEMGVDPVVVGATPPAAPVEAPIVPAGGWWLIGGITFGVLALALLAWWAFGTAPAAEE